MTTPYIARQEYVSVHEPKLKAIIDDVTRYLSTEATTVVEQEDSTQPEVLIRSQPLYTPESDEVSAEVEIEYEQFNTDLHLRLAKSALFGLRTRAALYMIANDPESVAGIEAPLPYGRARYANSRTDNLELTSATLTNVGSFRTVGSYVISQAHELVAGRLSIYSADARLEPTSLRYSVEPLRDTQLQNWAATLGNHFGSLLPYLAGRYKDEDELNNILNDTWLSFQGTSQEDEVGPVLESVRFRAVAAKESKIFNSEFNFDLPSADILEDIHQKVASLS